MNEKQINNDNKMKYKIYGVFKVNNCLIIKNFS